VSTRSEPRTLDATPIAARIARGAALMDSRGADFARTARRFTPAPEDADDALQRATEILLRKGPDLEPAALAAWMHVVTRREAMAVGRARRRPPPFAPEGDGRRIPDPDFAPSPAADPAELFERRERVARMAERLSRLKPAERRAVALQAAGCSYAEIQAITGWTYTKVNRSLAEGRAALRRLETGEAQAA